MLRTGCSKIADTISASCNCYIHISILNMNMSSKTRYFQVLLNIKVILINQEMVLNHIKIYTKSVMWRPFCAIMTLSLLEKLSFCCVGNPHLNQSVTIY